MSEIVNPVFVEVTRGDIVETRHRGSAAVVNGHGEVLASWGNIDEPVYLRSSTKPMQGIPLIESGAADAYNLTEKEITLGCSSHYTEDYHEEVVTNWLNRIEGLSLDDLECGPPTPDCLNRVVLARRGITEALAVHNNCSGKHANFLTVCKHLGFETKNYIAVEHQVQKMVTKTLGEMAEADMDKAAMAYEGCGVPAFAFSRLEGARAYGKFALPEVLPAKRGEACRRIMKAMMTYPDYFGGNKCFDSTSTAVLDGVICKEGNRGTQVAIVPAFGVGVVVKIEDGQGFAKECAMGAILKTMGLVNKDQEAKLAHFMRPDVLDGQGNIVGKTRPNRAWLESMQELKAKLKPIPDWKEKLGF